MSDIALKIVISPDAATHAFRIENGFGEKVEIGNRSLLDQQLLQQQALRARLDDVLQAAGPQLKLDWPTANEVLVRLHRVGLAILLDIVGDEKEKLPKIQDICRTAFDRVPGGTLPTVQIVSPPDDFFANCFPFEILPLLSTKRPRVVDYPSLDEALSAFIGFSAIVERSSFRPAADFEIERTSGCLPIKFFQNASLPGVEAEGAFLCGRRDLDVDGPWPIESAADGPAFVAGHIADPALRLSGDPRAPVDQIQHFSCHCDTATGVKSHFFSLQAQGGDKIDIDLLNLATDVAYYLGDRRIECEMPLIFFNNCGGASVDPRQIGSFVKFFAVNNRNRGFIGTQTRIPDKLAKAFSELFYVNLLRERMRVGAAVTAARRTLALRYSNPLSILYIHYGPAALAIGS
jgi:hypothetical protein